MKTNGTLFSLGEGDKQGAIFQTTKPGGTLPFTQVWSACKGANNAVVLQSNIIVPSGKRLILLDSTYVNPATYTISKSGGTIEGSCFIDGWVLNNNGIKNAYPYSSFSTAISNYSSGDTLIYGYDLTIGVSDSLLFTPNKIYRFLGNVTVNGALNIQDNNKLLFESAKTITINGRIYTGSNVVLTTNSSSGGAKWGGVTIETTGKLFVNGQTTIEKITTGMIIKNSNGITFNGNRLNIKNFYTQGIWVSGCSPHFCNVLINKYTGTSIVLKTIKVDTVSSYPVFEYVTVDSSKTSLSVESAADGLLSYCNFTQNNDKDTIILYSQSDINLFWGHNNICPKAGQYAINMVSDSDDVSGIWNYWGTSTPTDALFNYPGKVDYNSPHTSPVAGAGAYKTTGISDEYFVLQKGFNFEKAEDWDEALKVYRNLLNETSNPKMKRQALKSMLRVHDMYDKDYNELKSLLQNEIIKDDTYKGIYDFILCDLNAREGNYQQAITAFSSKAEEYRDTYMQVEMLARSATIYGDYLKDQAKAKEYADMAAAINPGQGILESAYSAAGIEYNSSLYEDKFAQTAEKPTQELQTDTEESLADVTVSPNPFNPATTINYSINAPGHVSLAVYNISGQKVATLVNGEMTPGKHSAQFDGSSLASGVYFYRFEAGKFAKTGKMLLVK